MKVSEIFARKRTEKTLQLIKRCMSDTAVGFVPGENPWPRIDNTREACMALYDAIKKAGYIPCLYINVPDKESGVIDAAFFTVGMNAASAYDLMRKFFDIANEEAEPQVEDNLAALRVIRTRMMEDFGINLPEIPSTGPIK